MNHRLRTHRAHLERVFADAEDLVFATIEVHLLIHACGLDQDDPLAHEAREAARHGSDALDLLNQAFVAVGS